MTQDEPNGRIKMGMVDVRDVATAHLLAIQNEAAANKRFLLVADVAWRREMAECLAAEFGPKGWSITTSEKTDDKVFGYECRTTQSREVLGLQYKPLSESWIDMANSLIESGFIKKPEAS